MGTPDRPLPGWPAALSARLAAEYLSLPQSTFLAEVAKEVGAVQLTSKRRRWLRSDLDNWLARRAGDDASSPSHNPWDDD